MSPLAERFVLHFGEMGGRWGINRTVSQIYALLFISSTALNADEIAEELGFSRSNVSMGLKELQSWRLVKLSHHAGDRREYFSTPEDIWTIFNILAEERRRREVDPTLSMLRDAMLEMPITEDDRHAQERMRQMYDLIELVTRWFGDVQKLDQKTLEWLMKLGSGVAGMLEATGRLRLPIVDEGAPKQTRGKPRKKKR